MTSYHLFGEKRTKARKRHQCIWCSYDVLPRSRYIRERSVYDGHFQYFAWHEACRRASDKWFRETREEEFESDNEMPFFELYCQEVEATKARVTQGSHA